MKLLGRYIASSVLWATLAVLLVILGLDIIFSLLDEMDGLKNDYALPQALNYLLVRLPGRIYLFLPVAILVGVLIGLGNLATTSELTVIRAAGVSIPRIILQACKPVFALLLLAMLASELWLPQLDQWAKSYRWEKLNAQQPSSLITTQDLWLQEGLNFYSINLARNDGQLRGIQIYRLHEDWSLHQMISAPRASYSGQEWQLFNAREVTFNSEQVQQQLHNQLSVNLPLQPKYLALQAQDAADLPPSQLWHYAQYLSSNAEPAGDYLLAFWNKTLLPVTVFAVVLLGASFTFGPLRSVPAGTRVFNGIIIALGVKFAQDLLGPSALIWGFNPIVAVLVPAGVCALAGLWLIYRAA